MTVSNGYVQVEILQAAIDPSGQARWTAADVFNQELAIEAASRWIDDYTHTRFFTTVSDETRYYTPQLWGCLFLQDDLLSITTLKTDDDDDGTYETTWTTSDYDLTPINASLESKPYRAIEVDSNSTLSFPTGVKNGVQIVGKFGYSSAYGLSAPAPIRQACLMIAHRLWKRKDAVFGVAGSSGVGVVTVVASVQADNDIQLLLDSGYSRRGGLF